MRSIIIVLFAFMISTGAIAQGKRNSIKMGVFRNSQPFSLIHLSYERALVNRLSFCLNAGIGYNTLLKNPRYVRWSGHASIEGRIYFIQRGGERIQGLFGGPIAAYNRNWWIGSGGKAQRFWASIGPVLGYQHFFSTRIVAAASVSLLWSPDMTTVIFGPNGKISSIFHHFNTNDAFALIQLGYLF